MYAGGVVEYGTARDIFYQPAHEYTRGLLASIPKLEAEEHERLKPIPGVPVDVMNLPAGCPFAPRCNSCMKVCIKQPPPPTYVADGHYSACWLTYRASQSCL
jgi:oligopeptide transport system ATP-binding protein